jgi:hypothetical protein
MEEQLIIEIWDTFRDYIPEKSRETASNQFLDFLVGKDVEVATLESLMGYDPHLDSAIELVLADFRDEDDDTDNFESDGDDAEDY